MLSERQDTNYISFWLSEWLRLGGGVPKEFTSDMSLALLNAAAISFANHPSLNSYMDTLFNMYMSETFDHPLPKCFLRIDIAHLVNATVKCDALHNERPKVKEFFIRCVTLLMSETEFKTAVQHIRDVITVALSTTEGKIIFCSISTKSLCVFAFHYKNECVPHIGSFINNLYPF